MKNIYLLPTDKPSRLSYSKVKTNREIKYKLELKQEYSKCNNGLLSGQRHIYITSDEEIKELDKSLLILEEFEPMILTHYEPVEEGYIGKKIIITTDQDLIKDGVQEIDDEFLEWFIKNPNCEEIEVVDVRSLGVYGSYYPYKINIPKKETKQETLEEAAKKCFKEKEILGYTYEIIDGFILGAKWQQEQEQSNENSWFNEYQEVENYIIKRIGDKFLEASPEKYNTASEATIALLENNWKQEQNKNLYSEEEVHEIILSYQNNVENSPNHITYNEWFEQFKK